MNRMKKEAMKKLGVKSPQVASMIVTGQGAPEFWSDAEWLEYASVAGRLLEGERPASSHR